MRNRQDRKAAKSSIRGMKTHELMGISMLTVADSEGQGGRPIRGGPDDGLS